MSIEVYETMSTATMHTVQQHGGQRREGVAQMEAGPRAKDVRDAEELIRDKAQRGHDADDADFLHSEFRFGQRCDQQCQGCYDEQQHFILKFIIGLVCGAVSHKVIHLRTFPTGNKFKYVAAVTASAFSGLLVNVFTDPFIGYFRNLYIFGQPAEFVSVVTKIASGVTLVNSLLSTVCAVVLYIALRPALEKAHLLPKE